MLNQVIDIDEFNAKAHSRKLSYLQQAGQTEELRKALKLIKLAPSCYDQMVRDVVIKIDKEL